MEILIEQLSRQSFDVVLIAGDLGDLEEARVVCRELASFGKPVFYVMGNWDSFSYGESLHKQATHIHLNHQRVGRWVFLGYSGSAANGYSGHPTLSDAYTTFEGDLRRNKRKFGSFESYCKTLAFKELSTYISEHQIDVEDLVLVTHDRLYAPPFFPMLYIFGHRHQPKHTMHKGVNLVNTSAVSMDSLSVPPDTPGNFCLIELEGLDCQVEFHVLPSPYIRQADVSDAFGVYRLINRKTGEDVGCVFEDE